MFKKFLNNKGKEWFGSEKMPDKSPSVNQGDNPIASSPLSPSIDQKPFKVNLNELWQYDYEELSEFIHQYEEYVKFLQQRCHEAINRCMAAEDQVERLKQESGSFSDRVEPKKPHRGELIETFTPTGLSTASTNNRSELELKQIEDFINEKLHLTYVDEGLLKGLQETTMKVVEQLSEIRNVIWTNTSADLQPTTDQVNFDLLGDNLEADQEVQASAEDKLVNIKVTESFKDDLINNIGDIEMTVQLVIPKLMDINNKVKNQEKVIIKEMIQAVGNIIKARPEIQSEMISPEVSKAFESEGGEVRAQLDDARARLTEAEKRSQNLYAQQLSSNTREESLKQEIKTLNGRIGELEKKIKELENNLKKSENLAKDSDNKTKQAGEKIKQMETKLKDMEGKVKEAEKSKKDAEAKVREGESRVKDADNKIKEAETRMNATENKFRDAEARIRDLENQREEIRNQLDVLRIEYQSLISTNQKVEGEISNEVTQYLERISHLENENVRLQNKAIEAEHSKTDLENKVIQERLKHHQTISDMQKSSEALKEAQKDLGEEVEAHKATVLKYESHKKKVAESEKKMIDYKRTIKKLSQQVLDLHNKLNELSKKGDNKIIEKVEDKQESQTHPLIISQSNTEANEEKIMDHGDTEKEDLGSTQTTKFQEIQEKLQEANKEITILRKKIDDLIYEKAELSSQVKVLHDKRESGLLEIQRLNNAIDKLKVQHPNLGLSVVQPVLPKDFSERMSQANKQDISSPNKVHLPSPSLQRGNSASAGLRTGKEEPSTQTRHQASKSISGKSGVKGSSHISNMKKNLDQLYKEVILVLTSDKLNTKKKPGNEEDTQNNKGDEELSESMVKIEKKVNDAILLLQDYVEIIAKKE